MGYTFLHPFPQKDKSFESKPSVPSVWVQAKWTVKCQTKYHKQVPIIKLKRRLGFFFLRNNNRIKYIHFPSHNRHEDNSESFVVSSTWWYNSAWQEFPLIVPQNLHEQYIHRQSPVGNFCSMLTKINAVWLEKLRVELIHK